MKHIIWCLLLIGMTGCFENQNSSTDDAGGLIVNPGDSPEFVAAKSIFSASCGGGGCHNDFASKTEAQFVAEGLVVPGDPDASKVFCRLQGSTGSCGSKNMPQFQPALDAGDLQAISDWVTSVP